MWGNVNYLQSAIHKQDIPYIFIAERGVRMPNCGCLQQILTSDEELNLRSYDGKISRRSGEYLDLFNSADSSIFVFLTNYSFELDVWKKLLKDRKFHSKVKQNNHLVVVHITALSLLLFKLLDDCSEELNELKENIFFSFFSELQPLIVKRFTQYENCFTLFHTGHEAFSIKNRRHGDGKYLSYLGFYNWTKNPNVVLTAFKRMTNDPFHIQFYPIKKNNSLLFAEFNKVKRNHDFIDCRRLSAEEYKKAIFSAKVGLLPYDSYNYAVQASGLLEEYLFAGVPVVVPKDTWLSFFHNLFTGGGLVFDPEIEGDFECKITSVLEDYGKHKKLACFAAEQIAASRGVKKYLSILYKLDVDRACADVLTCDENHTYLRAIQKGVAYHFARFAEEAYCDGNVSEAQQFLSIAEQSDNAFWEIDLLKILFKTGDDKKMLGCLSARMQGGHNINPYRLIEKLEKYCINSANAENVELIKKIVCQTALCDCMSFEQLYKVASLCKTITHFDIAEEFFIKVTASDDVRLKSGALFHLGEINLKLERLQDARDCFERCLNVNPAHERARELLNCVCKKEVVI